MYSHVILPVIQVLVKFSMGCRSLKFVGRSDCWPYSLIAESTSHTATTKFPTHPINRLQLFFKTRHGTPPLKVGQFRLSHIDPLQSPLYTEPIKGIFPQKN